MRLATPAGRGALCAQQDERPYTYHTVQRSIELDEVGADDRSAIESMAIRYLGDELGRAYAQGDVADDEIRIRLRPDRWFSVDYGK